MTDLSDSEETNRSTGQEFAHFQPEVKYPHSWVFWVSAVVFLLLGALSFWLLPNLLLETWLPKATPKERGAFLPTASQAVLFALGGTIAVIGVCLSLIRHGNELRSSSRENRHLNNQLEALLHEREKEENRRLETADRFELELRRELRERFVSAVGLLSSAPAIERKAGLYALAALADDWKARGSDAAESQVMVDVICGYLRSPMPEEELARKREIDVRNTGFTLIRQHLPHVIEGALPHWRGMRFDLSKASIDYPVDLSSISLTDGTEIDFSGSSFTDSEILMDQLRMDGKSRLNFHSSAFDGAAQLSIFWSRIEDSSLISFKYARFSRGAQFDASMLVAKGAAHLDLKSVSVQKASLHLHFMTWVEKSRVVISESTIGDSSRVDFSGTEFKDEASLTAKEVVISGRGELNLTGDTISFNNAGINAKEGPSRERRLFLLNAKVGEGSLTLAANLQPIRNVSF